MIVTQLDAQTVRELNERLQLVLDSYLKIEGVRAKVVGGAFSSDAYHPRVVLALVGIALHNAQRRHLELNARRIGLTPAAYGRTVERDGQPFKLVGMTKTLFLIVEDLRGQRHEWSTANAIYFREEKKV